MYSANAIKIQRYWIENTGHLINWKEERQCKSSRKDKGREIQTYWHDLFQTDPIGWLWHIRIQLVIPSFDPGHGSRHFDVLPLALDVSPFGVDDTDCVGCGRQNVVAENATADNRLTALDLWCFTVRTAWTSSYSYNLKVIDYVQ